jgi:hypothetical protein
LLIPQQTTWLVPESSDAGQQLRHPLYFFS